MITHLSGRTGGPEHPRQTWKNLCTTFYAINMFPKIACISTVGKSYLSTVRVITILKVILWRYTLVKEIITSGVMEKTQWTEWFSRSFIIILALPPTRCMIQEKSLNLPRPISSSNLGCNSEFLLTRFLKQGPQPNVRFLLRSNASHQILVDRAQGPFSSEELGTVQPADNNCSVRFTSLNPTFPFLQSA